MSVYSIKGKGWRYDFTLAGQRYTEAWFSTKRKAQDAEATKRKEISEPPPKETRTPTDMGFLELLNRRLDHVRTRNSERHYMDTVYMAKRWIKLWGKLMCGDIRREMVERFVQERSNVSAYTANKEIRFLRATFNFGMKKEWISANPVDAVDFFPVDKRRKYIPNAEDIAKVVVQAESDQWLSKRYPDIADYLKTVEDTLGRMSEINRLEWGDVNFAKKHLTLYSRKIDGGFTAREIPMTDRLEAILSRRYAEREDESKPWVFWNRRTGRPYEDRKRVMRRLCKNAGVSYFRFHPIRHSSASSMDNEGVPKTSIQRILGHRNGSTTEIYLHSVGDSERRAIKALEKARLSHRLSHRNGIIG